jgi:hypothetical protein
MTQTPNPFKLIIAGNTNIIAMINVVIQATLTLRSNISNDELTFRQIHIFHTEQSLEALMSSKLGWREALLYYNIPTTCIIHHVTKLEDSNIDRYKDLVEQLRTIVNPLDNAYYYIDLTNGISALKAILAVFAYVLDIENIYSLEVEFSKDPERRRLQSSLFYHQLVNDEVSIKYRKFPPIRDFDEFGKRNLTEVLRHRQIINETTNALAFMLPTSFDIDHLKNSLLSGVNSRLIGEVTDDVSTYRHSVFSFAAATEEISNIILSVLKSSSIENKTLGQKLNEIKDFFTTNPKYFINESVLEHLTKLIAEIRNDIVHPSSATSRNKDAAGTQAYLSSQLTMAFLRFATKSITAFLDHNGKLVDVQTLDPAQTTDETVFYFGFDGDSTGDYLEAAFNGLVADENEVLRRSQIIRETVKEICNLIRKRSKDKNSILFAEGDNILFKLKHQPSLMSEVQQLYKEKTGLNSSIGYGKTLQEATIAMRLAKARQGDSVVGITIVKKVGD